MRILAQRVTRASVSVDGQVLGAIESGLLLFVAIGHGDTHQVVAKMAEKVAHLRIFSDPSGKFNDSLMDIQGQAMVVSQFTLYADLKRGRRPSFLGSAAPDHASSLVDQFVAELRRAGVERVATGQFGAMMDVALVNHGPVTIWLDSDELC